MRLPGTRGQVSAPFELLVAVILMTFVIIIGTTALMTLQKEKCFGEMGYEMDELKVAIQRVATQKGKQSLTLALPACYDERETIIKIKEFDDTELCSSHCGGGSNFCTILVWSNPKAPPIWKCLKISPLTVFSDAASTCTDYSASDYTPIDLRATGTSMPSIPPGNYTLVSKFNVTSSFPIICAYRRN